jgi:hypothetical protein
MAADLAKARKKPLFNATALTEILWSQKSRGSVDKLVDILKDEPLFRKNDKYKSLH